MLEMRKIIALGRGGVESDQQEGWQRWGNSRASSN